MTRNTADFHEQILYHGSPTTVPVGGIIEPRNGQAFATSHIETAQAYAHGLFSTKKKGTVHQVEPLENDETLYASKKKSGELRSEKGFRVVRHVD